MAYEDKHGITEIIGGDFKTLDISRDTGEIDEMIAVLLFTPTMKPNKKGYIDHEHIELSVEQAEALADWLNKFIKEFKK